MAKFNIGIHGTVMDEDSYNSPNFTDASRVQATFGVPRNITGITIHHWGDDGQYFHNVANYLSRQNGGSSAHFVVEAGRVVCLVDPRNAAWHSGSAVGNATTIGIECRPEMSEGDFNSLVDLCIYLEEVYGSLNYYRHRDWSPTACPGRYGSRIDDLVNRVNEGLKKNNVKAPEKVQNNTITEVINNANKGIVEPYWTVNKGDTLSKIAKYYLGDSSSININKIAKYNNINANQLKIGQKIRIPAPLVWVVENGDTWDKIAKYYGYDINYLKKLNNNTALIVGKIIKIY